MATKVTTLKNADKTEDLVARTQLKAIFDKNGDYIDNDLLATDLNKLKGGVVDEFVVCTEDEVGVPDLLNADLLNGHPDTYFASKDDLTAWTFLETVTGTNTATLPSGWKALRLIANYTDDTIPFEITKEEYDKCTNGTQIVLSGGSLVRSTAVRVTPTTAGIAWFRTASISGGSLVSITNVESSAKLHVYYR